MRFGFNTIADLCDGHGMLPHFTGGGLYQRKAVWHGAPHDSSRFAETRRSHLFYNCIVMNTLFASSTYSANGPQMVNPKCS